MTIVNNVNEVLSESPTKLNLFSIVIVSPIKLCVAKFYFYYYQLLINVGGEHEKIVIPFTLALSWIFSRYEVCYDYDTSRK